MIIITFSLPTDIEEFLDTFRQPAIAFIVGLLPYVVGIRKLIEGFCSLRHRLHFGIYIEVEELSRLEDWSFREIFKIFCGKLKSVEVIQEDLTRLVERQVVVPSRRVMVESSQIYILYYRVIHLPGRCPV
ncbi:uncharacterized protein [Primulina huaijiensis]|uniref:uncharacterized protein n=1 Tax=Primulina huaijiensis TaxID=1492673 RepID=UPI003CC70105